jgi:hypothetical protein
MIPPTHTITEREVSRLEAEAGLQARAAAEHQGGDPAQISALARAAQAMPSTAMEPKDMIGGILLHRLVLLVTLCIQELQRQAAQSPARPSDLLTIARLVACFHAPHRAWHDLAGSGLSALDAWAIPLVAHWQAGEIQQFTAYIELLKKQSPSLEADQEQTPGKSLKRGSKG